MVVAADLHLSPWEIKRGYIRHGTLIALLPQGRPAWPLDAERLPLQVSARSHRSRWHLWTFVPKTLRRILTVLFHEAVDRN